MNTIRWIGFPFRFVIGVSLLVTVLTAMLLSIPFFAVFAPRVLKEVPYDYAVVNDAIYNWIFQ